MSVLGDVLLASVPAAFSGLLAYKGSTRSARIQSESAQLAGRSQVEAEAYSRAKAIYESGIQQLEDQLGRMRSQVDELGRQLSDERDVAVKLRAQIRLLEEQIRAGEQTIADLRGKLARAGIEAAEHVHGDGGAAPATIQ